MQYYVAARSAAFAALLPVTGNLYHHALEMMLKAGLSRTISTKDLKKKFSHRLVPAWNAFKAAFPSPRLVEFDSTIAYVDRWEVIRYPDKLLETGAQIISTGRGRLSTSSSPTPPIYRANGTKIDELVVVLFEILSKNPWAFYPGFSPHAREVISRYHPMPDRVMGPQANAAD